MGDLEATIGIIADNDLLAGERRGEVGRIEDELTLS